MQSGSKVVKRWPNPTILISAMSVVFALTCGSVAAGAACTCDGLRQVDRPVAAEHADPQRD